MTPRHGYLTILWGLVLALSLVVWGAADIFTDHSEYDDEGMITLALREALAGRVLYTELDTQYGPGFFLVHQLVFGALGLIPDHNSMRLWTLILGLASVGLVTAGFYRLTHRPVLTGCVAIALFQAVSMIRNEPAHPQALLALLAASAWFALVVLRPGWAWPLVGVAVGLAVTIKVNVGGLLLLAGCWTLVATAPPRWSSWLRWPLAGLLLLVPWVLMGPTLEYPPILVYALLATASLLGLVLRTDVDPTTERQFAIWLGGFLIATGATVALVLGWALARGTSLPALAYGMVGQHLGFANGFMITPPFTLAMAAIGLTGTLAAFRFAYAPPDISFLKAARPRLLILGLVFVVPLLATLVGLRGLPWLLALSLPFTWVFLPQRGQADFTPRLALVGFASFLFLQAYPISFAMRSFALWFVPVLVGLALADLLLPVVPGRAALLVAVASLFLVAGRATLALDRYLQAVPAVTLRGASWCRFSEAEAARLDWLNLNVQTNADAVWSVPGLFSVNLWSGLPPPTYLIRTNWETGFDAERQRQVLYSLERDGHTIVVVNEHVRQFWLDFCPKPPTHLAGEAIPLHFRLLAQAGDLKIFLRNNHDPTTLYGVVRTPEGTHLVVVAPLTLPAPVTLEVLDLSTGERLQPPDFVEGVLPSTALPLGSPPCRPTEGRVFQLQLLAPIIATSSNLGVRFRDTSGKRVLTLPLMSVEPPPG